MLVAAGKPFTAVGTPFGITVGRPLGIAVGRPFGTAGAWRRTRSIIDAGDILREDEVDVEVEVEK